MEEKKGIGSLFNRIAGDYDALNHIFSFGIDRVWRRQAVSGLQHADHLLDVAVGTADLAIEIMRQNKASKVTGIDLSDEMMRLGSEKVKKAGFDMTFVYGSAQQMPFSDASFDALTCGYGCRNFANLDEGLSEFYRVLRPGGELCILDFSMPSNPIIRWFYQAYFRGFMTPIGGFISGDKAAYDYFYRSVQGFIWGEQMVEHLRRAGFDDVTFTPQTFGISTLYRACKK